MIKNIAIGTGRRKTAVARVYLRQGKGSVVVNEKSVEDYFQDKDLIFVVNQPLDVTDNMGKFDIVVTVFGGGKAGQAEAIRHGLSRALASTDETHAKVLRANGFMTRDPRMVERKKYGQPGARRRFQFSKR